MTSSMIVYIRPHTLTDKSVVYNVVMTDEDAGKELFSLPAYDKKSAEILADTLVISIMANTCSVAIRR